MDTSGCASLGHLREKASFSKLLPPCIQSTTSHLVASNGCSFAPSWGYSGVFKASVSLTEGCKQYAPGHGNSPGTDGLRGTPELCPQAKLHLLFVQVARKCSKRILAESWMAIRAHQGIGQVRKGGLQSSQLHSSSSLAQAFPSATFYCRVDTLILLQVPDVCYRMSSATPPKLCFSVGNPEWAVHMSAFTWWTSTLSKSTLFAPAWASPDCSPA